MSISTRLKLMPANLIAGLFFCLSVASLASAEETKVTVGGLVWADNWFSFHVNGELVKEDSESINREQSFNAETFVFETTLPAVFSIKAMDFKETDSGIEYIGGRRQQMGDGGFKAEFKDAKTGELLAYTSSDWVCTSIHQAPLNTSCARSSNPDRDCQSNILPEPAGWTTVGFDDSGWANALEYTERQVSPHGDYRYFDWASESKIIWGEDLEIDNTMLCRITVEAP